jgi:hypothetical protein
MHRFLNAALAFGLTAATFLSAVEVDLIPKDSVLPAVQAQNDLGSSESLVVMGQPFAKALKVVAKGPFEKPWNFATRIKVTEPINAGDQIRLTFWARASGDTPAKLFACVGSNKADNKYYKPAAKDVTLDGTWKSYTIEGTSKETMAVGTVETVFFLGYANQALEIGPVSAVAIRP